MRTSPIDVLLSTWRADPVTLVVLVVAAMLCALGIRRAATRGVAWSHRRTATFYALGLGSYALVELGFLGTWSEQLRRAFTARIALLLLAIPGLIALGKPLELARAGLGDAGRARLDALVSGRTARLFGLFGHSVGVRLAGWGSAGRGRGPRGSVAPTAAPTEDLDVSHDSSGCADACSAACPCSRCDLLLGLDGVHVEDVDRRDGLLIVTVSSPAAPTGCPSCGVVATGRGRRRRVLHDVPGVTRVRIVWRQRVWRYDEVGCVRRTFVEQLPGLVARRGSITTRAVGWAIGQLRREHATVHGIARQLGTSWKTVWRAVEPELVKLALRILGGGEGVKSAGDQEHADSSMCVKSALRHGSVDDRSVGRGSA
ncbi:cytochrome c oxidase assembly protein [Microbacterium lacticum]